LQDLSQIFIFQAALYTELDKSQLSNFFDLFLPKAMALSFKSRIADTADTSRKNTGIIYRYGILNQTLSKIHPSQAHCAPRRISLQPLVDMAT